MDFIPRPEHHLTVAAMGTPNFNTQMRSLERPRVHLEPVVGAGAADQGQQRLHRPLDVEAATTTSWQIDALAGLHTEYFYDRSPDGALNNRNQLEYWGANL